ncbi:MBL fold metallo-hydrolase [Limibaculum sp. M0105]|uniref:MBL fold metallo-hydrolase n=1 Tax=Thermohalobaculum xanthum TaxID=2753746 RepID=A0A8J7SFA1_9RHOB|nr:MBL fold metallo-hydrolase [Thermohalobaculum xanthum]MBK0399417.1 MBL fold metallo-hydrolase [Thermohalobaculum xanthum]
MSAIFDLRPDVVHGLAEPVAPGVRRVTCANPSPMTFTGTRSYIVGRGEVAVIDPGPDDPAHLDAILGALEPGEAVAAILVTHSHVDHSPGARRLAARTGAPVCAFGPHGAGMSAAMRELQAAGFDLGGGEGADRGFAPDRLLAEGESVTGPGWRLTALHTPGHLSNHLAFALEGTGTLFTGDAVMGWTTTLVSPPEGDMAAQMATLRRLAARGGDRLYLPGHGHEVTAPAPLLAHLIAHRAAREEAILAALGAAGGGTAKSLAAAVYHDTDPKLLPAAARNVLATLLGLLAEGRVDVAGPLSADAEFRPA